MSWIDTVFNFLARGQYYANQQEFADGTAAPLQTNSRGHLLVDPYGGNATWQDPISAMSERVVKNTAGVLWQLVFHNVGVDDVFVFVFDHPSAGAGQRPPDGDDTVRMFVPIRVSAGQQQGIALARPRRFASGIYWGASSSAETFTYDAGAELLVSAEYG